MLNQIKQLIEACPAAPNNFKHHTGYIYYIRVYKSGETIYKVGYSYKKTFKDIAVSLKLPVDSKVELLYLSPGLPYYKVSRICKLIVLLEVPPEASEAIELTVSFIESNGANKKRTKKYRNTEGVRVGE